MVSYITLVKEKAKVSHHVVTLGINQYLAGKSVLANIAGRKIYP